MRLFEFLESLADDPIDVNLTGLTCGDIVRVKEPGFPPFSGEVTALDGNVLVVRTSSGESVSTTRQRITARTPRKEH